MDEKRLVTMRVNGRKDVVKYEKMMTIDELWQRAHTGTVIEDGSADVELWVGEVRIAEYYHLPLAEGDTVTFRFPDFWKVKKRSRIWKYMKILFPLEGDVG